MVRVLGGKSFVLEARSVCSNIVPQLKRNEHYVFVCLLGIMRIVIWTTRQKEVHGGEIRAKRRRLSSSKFGKRWLNASRLVRLRGANLE